jgi:hypothetical protein
MIKQVEELIGELVRRACVAISEEYSPDDEMTSEAILELAYPCVTQESIEFRCHYDGSSLYEFNLKDLDGGDDEIRQKIKKRWALNELRRLDRQLREIESYERMVSRRTQIESRIANLREILDDKGDHFLAIVHEGEKGFEG